MPNLNEIEASIRSQLKKHEDTCVTCLDPKQVLKSQGAHAALKDLLKLFDRKPVEQRRGVQRRVA